MRERYDMPKVIGKDCHLFFYLYVSFLSVSYMQINMSRVQRDAPKSESTWTNHPFVCLLTFYVHLIKS